MRFEDLRLIDALVRAVHAEGYSAPTPIQEQAIPHVLEGKDLLGCAQTGTGKTAAFALPILQRMAASPKPGHSLRVLVLSPTRELATQIGDSFAAYGRHLGFKHSVIFGGVAQRPQEDALRRGIDILVATPGRLLDLMSQRLVNYSGLEVLVLDEADRMLDMGFIHDVRKIIAAVPRRRQTLFFSATMPEDIRSLADSILTDPVRVAVSPVASTVEKVEQRVYFVEKNDKRAMLEQLMRDPSITRALVFTRTKHGANRVAEWLSRAGVRAEAIHGNKSQNARERALEGFRRGALRALVATDIAARGIDIDDISHVINFEVPNVPETYVHRIGRTARAGATGIALTFCDAEEREFLWDIQKLIKQAVPVASEHPFRSSLCPPPMFIPGEKTPRPRSQSAAQDAPPRQQSSPRGYSGRAAPPRPAEHGRGPRGGGGWGRR